MGAIYSRLRTSFEHGAPRRASTTISWWCGTAAITAKVSSSLQLPARGSGLGAVTGSGKNQFTEESRAVDRDVETYRLMSA